MNENSAGRPTDGRRRESRPQDGKLFPGESLDLPEENPRHYDNYNNNYGRGRGVRNFNNGYGRDTGPLDPRQDWDETGQAVDWAGGWDPDPEPWQEPEEDWADRDESWEEEPLEEPQEAPRSPLIRAYNSDFQDAPELGRKKPRSQAEKPKPDRSLEDLEQAHRAGRQAQGRNKKKHRFWRKLLVFLLVLAALAIGLCFLLKKMPQTSDSLGERKPGCATVLLVGLDDDKTRTDTMMLLYLDGENGGVNLLSLPRDIYVGGDYYIPKLNSVYGDNGGGKEGMNALLDEIQDLIGYRPDGYLTFELTAFVDVVDAMGGVKFDVPQDMQYDDPSQDLHIDLKAGTQRLNGEDAMGLVRYRSGYAMADLRRVEVQRDFVEAAMDQWLKPWKVIRYPGAALALLKGTQGDLSLGNLVWVADALRKADFSNIQTETLPGEPATIGDGSYYLAWPNATAELINTSFNPFYYEITAEDLNIAG